MLDISFLNAANKDLKVKYGFKSKNIFRSNTLHPIADCSLGIV